MLTNSFQASPTNLSFPAPSPTTKSKVVAAIKNTSGIVQLFVTSNSKPNRGGPEAASKYPKDCAIPERFAASYELRVRSEKNIMTRPNAHALPMPIRMAEGRINVVPPNNTPHRPATIVLKVTHTSGSWFFIRPAITGTMNVNGSCANWMAESIHPAVDGLIPRPCKITGSQATSV